MRRQLLGLTALAALVVGGLALAQDRNDKTRGDDKKPTETKGLPPPPAITVDQLMKDFDTNKDGFIDRKEAPPFLLEHFDEIDLNKDGKLSREELAKALPRLMARRRPSDVAYILIEMSDCDDDCSGELQQLYDVLRKLDTKKNGKIDPEALKEARRQLADERVNQIFADLDTNKDGKISREEARGMIKKNFDQIDRNKDGFIDRDEMRQAILEGPPKPPPPPKP